jgi:hypothetical protein
MREIDNPCGPAFVSGSGGGCDLTCTRYTPVELVGEGYETEEGKEVFAHAVGVLATSSEPNTYEASASGQVTGGVLSLCLGFASDTIYGDNARTWTVEYYFDENGNQQCDAPDVVKTLTKTSADAHFDTTSGADLWVPGTCTSFPD